MPTAPTHRAQYPLRAGLGALAWTLAMGLLTACNIGLPPQPTAVPALSTRPFTPTSTTALTPSITPTPDVTPSPSSTPRPTVTLPPTATRPPHTATPDPAAQNPPQVADLGGSGLRVILTEAQVNAALARLFDADPLPNYTAAPRAVFEDGTLSLTLSIVPARAPVDAQALVSTLTVKLGIVGGVLETQPTRLMPLNAGVTTQQIKRGEALLHRALEILALEAAGGATFFYNETVIRPGVIILTLIRTGG